MAHLSIKEAVRKAYTEEMQRDSRVFVFGQDIELIMWNGDAKRMFGGRIINVPVAETGFVGAAIGAAMTGSRPIIEMSFATFMYSAMDQIVNQAAKIHYMFGGQAKVPLVIRSPTIYNIGLAAHHSDRLWGMFAQAPGLKIIVPATPYDAKGLLKSAIRDDNPVVFFDDVTLATQRSEVPDDEYTIPLGVADVKRRGTDISIVAVGGSVPHSLAAADELAKEGISAEVVDVRSVVPLDHQTIVESVIKTGRLLAVDPAPRKCGLAAEIAALISELAFEHLRAPVARLTAPDVPVPFSPALEQLMYPTAESIRAAAHELCSKRGAKDARRVSAL